MSPTAHLDIGCTRCGHKAVSSFRSPGPIHSAWSHLWLMIRKHKELLQLINSRSSGIFQRLWVNTLLYFWFGAADVAKSCEMLKKRQCV